MKTRACIAPGDSGAPAIDARGMVVGVVSSSSGDYQGAIDYLRPVNLLTRLIRAADAASEPIAHHVGESSVGSGGSSGDN